MPGILQRAIDAFGVRHRERHTPVAIRDAGDALRRAVRIGRITLSRATEVVDEAQRDQALRRQRLQIVWRFELRETFAVRHCNRHARAFHAGQQHRGRLRHFDEAKSSFELLRTIAYESRPVIGAGNELAQRGHHLTAIAHTERERVGSSKERCEFLAQTRVEQNRFRPALTRSEHIAIREAAADDEALIVVQARPLSEQVGHVDIEGGKAGAIETSRHLDVAVHTLLAEDRHFGTHAFRDVRRCDVLRGIEAQLRAQARIARIGRRFVLLDRAARIVAQLDHAITRLRPCPTQLGARFIQHDRARRCDTHTIFRGYVAEPVRLRI